MKISEAARKSRLKVDTIRYYDSAGLIPKLHRGSDGQRRFSTENVEWLSFLYWLRETGMPMNMMKHFAHLYVVGDHTISERKEILLEHSRRLAKRRSDLDHCEEVLSKKLAIYEEYEK